MLSSFALSVACSLQGGRTDPEERAADSPSAGTQASAPTSDTGVEPPSASSDPAESEAPQPELDASSSQGSARVCEKDFATIQNEFGFAFEDSVFLAGCREIRGRECIRPEDDDACPTPDAASFEDRGESFVESFRMRGEVGKLYSVTISVNGIAEGKYYTGGVRRAGNSFDPDMQDSTDLFYEGGTPLPTNHRVYELAVLHPDGHTPFKHYYLNSVPQSSGGETLKTYELSYQATIDVPGQAVIRYTQRDADCRTVLNCGAGPDDTSSCPNARSVPNEPNLVVPSTYGGRAVEELNLDFAPPARCAREWSV